MAVRLTESRLPVDFSPETFGQHVQTSDGKVTLIGYISSPVVVNRVQQFVVFVTNATLAGQVHSYAWTIDDGGSSSSQNTTHGEISFTPQNIGPLSVSVRLLDSSDVEKASLTMVQETVPLNIDLESLITDATDTPGPAIGNIEVARELVNDHNAYYQQVVMQSPESGDGFKRFVFSMVCEGASQRSPAQRRAKLNELAAAINDGSGDFVGLTAEGAGVCKIRLPLLAMVITGGLGWTELPEANSPRAAADQELREALAALDNNKKIDLFNLVRFPKSNVVQCGRILEALRDRYFSGANFTDVLEGMSGTRAHWISRHYKEGPIAT